MVKHMKQTNSFSDQQHFNNLVDSLLVDIAVRIQLSPARYKLAVQRYTALSDWLDRQDSRLAGLVQRIYGQGSMAIGATIASRLTTDEQDVDFVVQLDIPISNSLSPGVVLDLLFESIRGNRGSRYYSNTERRTRCVTVHYADKMHADLTPMVRKSNSLPRESHLFHNRPHDPNEPDAILIANPYGFAEWFMTNAPVESEFASLFERREIEYERLFFEASAECDELPSYEPIHRKSKKLVSLQLIKRWRNIQYDKRQGKRPPSVMLSKLVADSNSRSNSLLEELLFQARSMRNELFAWHQIHKLIRVVNPVCSNDIFTDRWPISLDEQAEFIDDLSNLIRDLERLKEGLDLSEIQKILIHLFGEFPTTDVIRDYNKYVGDIVKDGRSRHDSHSGGLIVPAVTTGISGAVISSTGKATPRHTFFGDA